ncbi:MAG: hypothetical protein ACLTZY_09540 [Alistipes indistinctus]
MATSTICSRLMPITVGVELRIVDGQTASGRPDGSGAGCELDIVTDPCDP